MSVYIIASKRNPHRRGQHKIFTFRDRTLEGMKCCLSILGECVCMSMSVWSAKKKEEKRKPNIHSHTNTLTPTKAFQTPSPNLYGPRRVTKWI
jgi:hypothetical protein